MLYCHSPTDEIGGMKKCSQTTRKNTKIPLPKFLRYRVKNSFLKYNYQIAINLSKIFKELFFPNNFCNISTP